MPSKLVNVLPLFINVIIQKCQVGSLFPSGLLHSFTQVKVKKVSGLYILKKSGLAEWTLHLKKEFSSHSKMLL